MPTWLVVEDEPDLQQVLLAIFDLWSVDGLAFYKGTTVMDWLDQVDSGDFDDYLPNLALIDIRLPDMSGIDICRRIRKSKRLKNIPIVLITAYRMPGEDEESVMAQSGADMLIYKPLPQMHDLRSILDNVVSRAG